MYRAKRLKYVYIKKQQQTNKRQLVWCADINSQANGKQIHISGSHYVVNKVQALYSTACCQCNRHVVAHIPSFEFLNNQSKRSFRINRLQLTLITGENTTGVIIANIILGSECPGSHTVDMCV